MAERLSTNEKYPVESRWYFFDFGDFRASSDGQIVSVEFLAARNLTRIGEDEVPISGQVQAGMELQFRMAGGTAGDKYIVSAVVIDSDEQRLEMQGYLSIMSPVEPAPVTP